MPALEVEMNARQMGRNYGKLGEWARVEAEGFQRGQRQVMHCVGEMTHIMLMIHSSINFSRTLNFN